MPNNSIGVRSRRQFLQSAGGAAAVALLDALRPAWARSAAVRSGALRPENDTAVFDLTIGERRLEIAGEEAAVLGINGTVPGPLLEWHEGQNVVLNVSNRLAEDTSIHWHGILLPFEMDGVPGVTFPGIAPGTTFQYRFPVRQNGSYWYHSHSRLQEQLGVYGPLVVHPRDGHPVGADRDYVVMLSDWTFEDPYRLLRRLKKHSDYYNYQRRTLRDVFTQPAGEARREAWRDKLAWDRMRMMASDIADVNGNTYTYLMNGLHPAGNWTGLFRPGERVRLRLVNGSAMSIFNIRIPGLAMTVTAADGQNVVPVETDELQISTAETYDIVVEPREERAYTIMAESIDRSGYAAGTLAPRAGMRAPVPALRKPPTLSMVDMGMDHGAMGHGAMQHGATATAGDEGPDSSAREGSHAGHGGAHGGHARREHDDAAGAPTSPGPVVARHGPDRHGAGNESIAEIQRDRLAERPTGLENAPHRVLAYADLARHAEDFDERPADREMELHLTGHMERYMWSFDGVQFHEVDGPIEFRHGERLRLTLVNDTMMNHPIHLHGMWLEIENGQGRRLPRKHTINVMPASRVSALINADAPGRWAFHCHLLYHMEMGMFRVVRVS